MANTLDQNESEPASIFQSGLPLKAKLERARTELLDLSARNRLLNVPRSAKSARTLEVVDEVADEVYRLLVGASRAFTFLPGKAAAGTEDAEEGEIADLAQPEDDGVDERGVANRHADTRLQTRLTPAGLQKKLLDLYIDARTLEEEQGVNILFLVLGTLQWADPANSANVRHAPLVLVPVSLERGNAAEKFKLRWRQEDVASNLSLEAFLDRVHGLRLPAFEADENFRPSVYAAAVAEAIASKPGWSVQADDIVLGFFSFAKFLMYRDLDSDVWPNHGRLTERPLIRSLLSDGFDEPDDLVPEEELVDPRIAPSDMVHIVDSDSSQTLAIHEVRRGRNLVIQGPPGTGKSQTIANIIAAAVADGKTVLFVAEKMAALEVVKRRLDATGVGDACLELHSNKANKREVVKELDRTWQLGAPKGHEPDALVQRLTEARDRLNAHADRMHRAHRPSQLTPYEVIGQLARLRQGESKASDIALPEAVDWTPEEFRSRHDLLRELAERIENIGPPCDHAWYGVGLSELLPMERDRLLEPLPDLLGRLEALTGAARALAGTLELPPPATLVEIDLVKTLADRVAGAPALSPSALLSGLWTDQPEDIEALLDAGTVYLTRCEALHAAVSDAAWSVDAQALRDAFGELPADFTLDDFTDVETLVEKTPSLVADAARLADALGAPAATSVRGIDRLVRVAERVASAPAASPAAFAADLWTDGVDRAGDLAEAVARLEEARTQVGDRLSAAAWDLDLAPARAVLAAQGMGFLRFLSGEWRRSDKLVRSILATPKLPLAELLPLLDALARGQTALREVHAGDEFGVKAFGGHWRGERSASAPLRALVAWMRSLGDLGAEARLIAARRPDQDVVRSLGALTAGKLASLKPSTERVWIHLGPYARTVFGETDAAELGDLAQSMQALTALQAADAACRSMMTPTPEALSERTHILKLLAERHTAGEAVDNGEEVGREAFDTAWTGRNSDWASLGAGATWLKANGDIRGLASRVTDRAGAARTATILTAEREGLIVGLAAVCDGLKLDRSASLGAADLSVVPVENLRSRLARWISEPEALSKWVGYRDRAIEARGQNLTEFVDRLEVGALSTAGAMPLFETSVFESILIDMVRLDPEIGRFNGFMHDRLVREFADLDQQRIHQARREVVRTHHRRFPPSHGGAVGPLGVLRGEIARRRGHKPIRQLIELAAPAVQALKPVLMMSPLSVAQYLPPGALTFDLLVMDEASQIQPVDALGAIARCRQVVVVGDPQQLPPTAFFSKMTGASDEDDEDGDGARVADIESILGLFTARGLPKRMLRWHYRSRHESLIAVSNSQFYENKLFIVPNPHSREAGMGLRFHHVANGLFDTGKTRTNATEAKVVAQAIVEHAMNHPELSLGVAAFSSQQRRAILDQLEILRRGLAPEDEAFFRRHVTEPFFVKNLENVQGDERDVIYISVGYAASVPGGKVAMRFGPLGTAGGDRRLNVLISRAKRRCEVFSSITDQDIDPDFAASRKGVFAFRLFLHFARTGRLSLVETTGRDTDGVLEAQVALALQARGYQVHRNVGVAGVFVDLAISDPDHQGRYVLGVECDGASYRAGRSARDRDRIRKAALEDHGWTMHRLWSADWFQRPNEELERIVVAIEAAKAELGVRDAAPDRPFRALPTEVVSVEREHVAEIGLAGIEDSAASSAPYVEARLSKPAHLSCEIHQAPTGILTVLAEQVVTTEGPVHLDEIVARVRDAWGARRAGGRIQDAVRRAIRASVQQRRVLEENGFYALPGAEPVVRDRSVARSPTLRRPEFLPPAEIAVAVIDVVARNFGATEEQAVQAVSRALGFKATSGQLREVISNVLHVQLERGVLGLRGALVDLGPNAPSRNKRPAEPTSLELLIAKGEHERLEFKESLRWDIRQQGVNRKLEDGVVKTVAAFANHEGGALLIGVADDGSVRGVDGDLSTLGGSRDKFELHLTNLLTARFSEAFKATKVRVSFPDLNGKMICRVDVQPSREPVYVSVPDSNGATFERLFVRSGNASHEIPPRQIVGFVKERFDRN